MFKDKVLLITGGTGSFGNAVLKRLLNSDVKEIRILSRDEKKQEEMRIFFGNLKLKFFIGDVRNYESVYEATKGVDYVFHAAALKQVPSCEFYPMEAIRTNVLGTQNVLDAATACKVDRLVILSTDKAVYPINVMGISKSMAEKLMIAKSRTQSSSEPILCVTRYGNVMASRGSVIPLFVSQIKLGKPLTITDPGMTRFLMSLDESVNLVEYAFKHANQGDLFVQKAPASTVVDLAQALREIFNSNVPIKIIGTRHGEKLFESLISREEMAKADNLGNYFRIPVDSRDLNYAQYFSVGKKEISSFDDYTSHNTQRLNIPQIKDLLLKLDFIQDELHV
jgi:UDP-N-acetylglucosamine 4,6-dehydratase